MSEFNVIGKNIPKIDAREKVTGRAPYVADLNFPGMLYGKIVRCLKYAHAKVTKLDLSEAAKYPGVVKVLGPKDVTDKAYNTGILDLLVPEPVLNMVGDIADQYVFTDWVKHQGDAICGIIAKTEEAAERAAEKVIVEYAPLPVYLTAEESSKSDAIQFEPRKPGNRACQLPEQMFPNNAYGWGDVDEEMKKSDLIVEETFYVPKVKQCQMEPHAYIAMYDDRERLNIWTSTQMPKLVQAKLSRLFTLPMNRVKLNQMTVGGGFGVRLGMVGEPETCAMALAVKGRYVKVLYTREEDWLASETRHPGKYWIKMGFKNDGTPVATDVKWLSYTGAYYTHASGPVFTAGQFLLGLYKFGAIRFKGETYYTNHVPCGAYRSYGNAQTNWSIEQIVDRACEKLCIDPVEWRLKWHKDIGDDTGILGIPYESCALNACLEQGAKAFGWKEKRVQYANQTGIKRRGVGVSVMDHVSNAFPFLLEHTHCTIKMNEDATAELICSCSDLGTGGHTALQQIAAETLGLAMEDVHMKVQDTDASGFDIGAHASRTVYVGGLAVKGCAEKVKTTILDRAAQQLEANVEDLEMKDKQIFVKGSPDKSIAIKTICDQGIYNFMDPAAGKTIGVPGQIVESMSFFPQHLSPPFAATFVEVEVDTETGEIKLIEGLSAHDIGKAIHPPSVEGQLEGGFQQGAGMAMMEEMKYDDKGLCLNSNFTDYKMLGPSDMPKMKIILVEEPDPRGPYGAKSCGEGGCVTPTGAVANAVFNAIGIQIVEGPITPEKVLAAIKEKGLTF